MYQEKNPWRENENEQNTQHTHVREFRIRTQAAWMREMTALTTVPYLHPEEPHTSCYMYLVLLIKD